ncbi:MULTISPECIES: helix-turn-helix domain-containing protein [unclassified Duganella]|uniref:helix-turn-helix domain-containing protein n=1 Tax=unclassified Duganella TaxID=2636909 RepID=UPI0009E906C0|nr:MULTISPECIES: helix-turn-helix domain-containing protein [unclassified Duganella]
MAKTISSLLPASDALLREFGARLRLARLRRKLTAKQVAERAGMAPMTLRAVEHGGSGVTIGAYLAVMQVLGLEGDLGLLAKADAVGRELQDIPLHKKSRRREQLDSDKEGLHAAAGAASSRITNRIASLPNEALREQLDGLPLSQLRKVYEQLPSARLKEVVELLPSEQLKKLSATLPIEQIKRVLSESPGNRVKQIMESASLENANRTRQDADKSFPGTSSPASAGNWIERGGFSSAESLADLISSSPPVGKKAD